MSLNILNNLTVWASLTLKLHKRSKFEAILFLVIQFLWLAIPVCMESKAYNSKFLNSDIYYTLENFYQNQSQQLILNITLPINTFLLLFSIIDSLNYSFQKAGSKISSSYFKKFFSFIFRSHEYVLLLPSINSSFATLDSYPYFLSYINIVFCFLIGSVSMFTDFDFSLRCENKFRDFLQKGFYLKTQIGKFFLYILFFLILNIQNVTLESWIGLAIGLYQCVMQIRIRIFRDKEIRIIAFYLSLQLVFVSLASVIQQNQKIDNFLVLIFVVQLPISFIISKFLEKHNSNLDLYTNQFKTEIKEKSFHSNFSSDEILFLSQNMLDQINMSYVQYSQCHNSLFLEELSSNHKMNCLKYPYCFCYEQENINQNNSGFFDEQKRQMHLYSFINQMLKQIQLDFTSGKKSLSKNYLCSKFIYIHFLVEVCKKWSLALVELSLCKKYKQSTWYEKIYIEYLSLYIQENFQYETRLSNSLQKAINYEENLIKSFSLYHECLLQKLELVALINQNFIDINILNKICSDLLKKKNKLIQLFQILSSQNLKSTIYLTMISEFYQNFSHFKSEKYYLESYNQNKNLESQQEFFVMQSQNANNFQFEEKNCVIQIDIQQKNLGKITYAQSSFYEMFGYTQQDCNHLDQIIPNYIQSAHQQLLKQYLSSCNHSNKSIVEFNLLLGQNKQGWAIPIKLKFLITLPSNTSDICITAQIQRIKNKNSFIMCEINSAKLVICDKRFYKTLLSHHISPNEINKIFFSKLMPCYFVLSKQEQFDNNQLESVQTNQKTLLFIPKSIQNMQFQEMTKQLNDSNFEYYVNNLSEETYSVYSAEYIIQKHKNQFFSHNIISFLSIEKMQNNQNTSQIVNQFKEYLISHIDKEQFTYRSPRKKFNYNLNQQDQWVKKKKSSQLLPMHSTLASFSQPQDECDTKIVELYDKEQVYSQRSIGFTQRYKQIMSSEQNLIIEQLSNYNYKPSSKQNLDFKSRQNISSMENIEIPSNLNLLEVDSFKTDINKRDSTSKYHSQILSSQRLIDNQGNIYSPIFKAVECPAINSPKKNTYYQTLNVIQELEQSQAVENINLENFKNNMNQISNEFSKRDQSYLSNQEDSFNYVENTSKQQKIESAFKQNHPVEEKDQSKQHAKRVEFKQENQQQIQNKKQHLEYQSSQLSSDGSNNIKKQFFIEKIMKVKLNKSLYLLKCIGIIGISTLLLLQIISFILLRKDFELETQHFINVSWPMEIRTCDSLQLYYLQYVKFQSNNIFSTPDDENWIQFSKLNKQRIVDYNNLFYELNKQFIRFDKDDFPYFKNLTSFQIQYNFVKDFYTYDQIIPYSRQNSIYYFQYQWFYGFRRFSTNEIESINDEAIINENFVYYFKPNTDLQLSIEDTTLSVLSKIENQIKDVMIISILLTFIIVSSILPVYFNIQSTNQEMLKLFSTFEPRALVDMAYNLQNSVQLAFQIQKKMRNQNNGGKFQLQKQQKAQIQVEQLMLKMQSNPKNKVISSMNNLQRISLWLLLSCLLVYVCLIIQPIVNNSIISSLIEQQAFNLKLMKTIYDLKAHFGSNLYLNMGNVLERMCEDCAFYDRNYFKERVPVFFDLNQQKLQGLYEVVTNQNGYEKYNSELYNEFLIKIMQGNLCEVLRDYPQYLDKNFAFNFDLCSGLQQTILTKGFMISSKYLLEMFPPLFQLTQDKDLSKTQEQIRQWVSQKNLIQYDEFITHMLNTITALKNFMIDMSNKYINFADKVELFLLIFYCIFLTIFMYFSWKILYARLKDSLIITRHSLSLIDINYLFTNPYIVNHINKL